MDDLRGETPSPMEWLRIHLHADIAAEMDDSEYQILKAKRTDYHSERINRAEAELTILHWHEGVHSCQGRWGSALVRHTDDDGGCWTVRMLAFGYRHRSGWQEEWKP